MRDWILWLNETPWSIALRESLYVWPLLEAAHVLTIMLFVGTIVMVDLRLLGLAFTRVTVSEMTGRVLPWTVAGFIVMIVTGLVLFYAKPLLYYHNLYFRAKMVLLILAMANILLFHRHVQRTIEQWDSLKTPPAMARLSAALSLSAWIGIVILGRMIAYDFLNCEKLDPNGLLSTLASCPAAETAVSQE